MQQLTEHFSQEELGVLGEDQRLIDNAKFLCETVLEPVRAHFGSIHVHCGYRDPAHNARVGGKPDSFHLFAGGHAAADISVAFGATLNDLFDWIRLESEIQFDKVILESTGGRPACVHIQVDRLNKPRREAYTGGTGACHTYTPALVH